MHAASRRRFEPHLWRLYGLQRRARVTVDASGPYAVCRRPRARLRGLLAGTANTSCAARSWRWTGTRQEITIKHDDIRGFMPGMTMPFKVRDARLLDGRAAGDLVNATLVVENATAYFCRGGAHGARAVDGAAAAPARWTSSRRAIARRTFG